MKKKLLSVLCVMLIALGCNVAHAESPWLKMVDSVIAQSVQPAAYVLGVGIFIQCIRQIHFNELFPVADEDDVKRVHTMAQEAQAVRDAKLVSKEFVQAYTALINPQVTKACKKLEDAVKAANHDQDAIDAAYCDIIYALTWYRKDDEPLINYVFA